MLANSMKPLRFTINHKQLNRSQRVKTFVSVCDMRKKYETNVNGRIKDNVNQLLVLGTTDFKMMYELLKEVDQFHREKIEELKVKYQGKQNTSIITKPINDDTTNENIFLEEKQ